MTSLALSPGTLASLVITLAFAAGLNVYATVLALGAMARLHWIVLPSGLEAVANPWIIGVAAVLFAAEFFADKVPGFDLVWNALHTFVRIPIAALLAYGATTHLPPELQMLATVAGALIAAAAHGSKNALRLLVTPSPEPVSNIALSTSEDGAALGLTWLVFHYPLVTGGAVAGVCLVAVGATVYGISSLRRAWRRRFGRGSEIAVSRVG